MQLALNNFKVKKTRFALASFAALPLVAAFAHSFGVIRQLRDHLPRRRHRRGFNNAEKVMALVLLQIAGKALPLSPYPSFLYYRFGVNLDYLISDIKKLCDVINYLLRPI